MTKLEVDNLFGAYISHWKHDYSTGEYTGDFRGGHTIYTKRQKIFTAKGTWLDLTVQNLWSLVR